MKNYKYSAIPDFALNNNEYPQIAQTLAQLRLTFYCMNCMRKEATTYITPNFGPLCYDCVQEMKNGTE